MTARAQFEQAAWAEWKRYKQNTAAATPCPCTACRNPGDTRTPADHAFIAAIQAAADKYAYGAATARRRDEAHAASIDAALARLRREAVDA